MTDANFLRTDIRPDGQRCMYATMEITRDQLLQMGQYAGKPFVMKTKNYLDSSDSRDSNDDVILVPSLRNEKDKPKG